MNNDAHPDYVEPENALDDPQDEVASEDFVDPHEFPEEPMNIDLDEELDSPGESAEFTDYPDYFQESEQE